MLLLNFSNPFREMQIIQAETVLEQKIERVIDLPLRLDSNSDCLPQVRALLKKLPVSSEDLKQEPLVINLPSGSVASALVLAYFHETLGYFPPVLRTRVRAYGLVPLEEVIEVIDPHQAAG
jgi:hypothetical protein